MHTSATTLTQTTNRRRLKMTTKTKTATYTLRNTFSDCDLSRHKTLSAAVRAMGKHARGTKRANGARSYLTYEILDASGEKVSLCDIDEAR
jgi:hypothetical protein